MNKKAGQEKLPGRVDLRKSVKPAEFQLPHLQSGAMTLALQDESLKMANVDMPWDPSVGGRAKNDSLINTRYLEMG